MIRQISLAAAVAVLGGCVRDRQARDPVRPEVARATEPVSRTKPVTAPTRISSPDDLKVVPASLEEPASLDDRKTLPERREERKERRDERREERKELPTPKAESKVEPKVEAKPAVPSAAKPAGDLAAIRKLYEIAAGRYEQLVDFEAHLTRREVVGKVENPTEEVLFQYRKKPLSIYMKTIGEHGRGREVLYVDGQNDGKMFVIIGEGDGSIFAKTGSRMAFAPNNPLVTAKSRHKITEAGFGDSLAKFGKVIALSENGTRPGGVKSLGRVTRKEYADPLEGVEIALQPGDDPTLPRGGKKSVYFDMKENSPSYGFPVLVITHDDAGREVEYYLFDKFKNPANLKDSNFSPDRLQAKRK